MPLPAYEVSKLILKNVRNSPTPVAPPKSLKIPKNPQKSLTQKTEKQCVFPVGSGVNSDNILTHITAEKRCNIVQRAFFRPTYAAICLRSFETYTEKCLKFPNSRGSPQIPKNS